MHCICYYNENILIKATYELNLAALASHLDRQSRMTLKDFEKLRKCLKVQGLSKIFWRSILNKSINKQLEKLQKVSYERDFNLKGPRGLTKTVNSFYRAIVFSIKKDFPLYKAIISFLKLKFTIKRVVSHIVNCKQGQTAYC